MSRRDRRRTGVFDEQIAMSFTRRRMPLRVSFTDSGALAFLRRRKVAGMLSGVMAPHGITVHCERRLNPRWIELRRNEQSGR